ncbi:ectonucleotide pyrophosphatase/phosphodiesterase [Caloramator proteoclasticus]|uniref:Predicted pyrophosphatase or phosphodiesterase, AlkP superfamily n=1 Tax=Caloramator proteoclasticus DSM 10124 TaxID=1121262 RepID=A0A1M4VJ04_9CLOT|nr:ectonucleotide pyrophosphatase/phosphodiesterase [Caloramator proteoclasticus]SHE68938.1 Predicted pyrophosphatase or phosphodiesterase, AlkP superfamily [Caloramator proteoclasticus DSM 10124]
MEEKLIVISFDALCTDDFKTIRNLPTFNYILNNSIYSLDVEPVYPTLTYPNHASIITGKRPYEHGIVNNTKLQPSRTSPDWFWYKSDIKCETILDIVKNNGGTICTLLWPTTGGGKIDYNMPEIFANRPWQNQIVVSLLAGSKLFQLSIYKKFGKMLNGLKQPNLDDFVLESALYTLKYKRPNLVLVHFTDLDTQKHIYGTKSEKVKEAILRHEERLKRIFDVASNLGYKIAILGDHGSLDVHSAISLNEYFKQKKLSDYLYFKSCDGSAYIYLRREVSNNIKDKIYYSIEDFSRQSKGTIEKIFTASDYIKLGFDKNAFLMLEPSSGYCFTDKNIKDYIAPSDHRAAHGQLPNKHKTLFCLWDRGETKRQLNSIKITDIKAILLNSINLK